MQLVEGEGWIDWRRWKAAKLRQSGRPANQSCQAAGQSCQQPNQSCRQAFAGQWCLSCQSCGRNQCEVQLGSEVEFTLISQLWQVEHQIFKHKHLYCKRTDWSILDRQRLVQIVEKFWEVSWSIWQQAAGETGGRRGFLRDATSSIHVTLRFRRGNISLFSEVNKERKQRWTEYTSNRSINPSNATSPIHVTLCFRLIQMRFGKYILDKNPPE